MKRLLFSFLSPSSLWLAFQTVLVLHQSFMLVCMPSQPCRWWPVQPVEKQPLCLSACARVCVCVLACFWECLFVVRSSPKGSDLFTKLGVSLRDSIVCKRYIIINFSVFVVFCFDRQRESQADDWIHILPRENPPNLFLSFCQQGHPNFVWVHHNVLGISSAETRIQTFAVAACVDWRKGAASFYLKSIANRLFPPWD